MKPKGSQFKGPLQQTTDFGQTIYTSHGSQHGIIARSEKGNELGRLVWNARRIGNVEVNPENRRQGIATTMYKHAQLLAELNTRIPQPKHSDDRTKSGDAWARAVGGKLPRMKKD